MINQNNKDDMKKSGIYAIVSQIDGKQYIGSAKNIKNRLCAHFSCLKHRKHNNRHLQRAYNKYGKDNFKAKILELCNEEERLNIEQGYLNMIFKISNHYDFYYNMEPDAFKCPDRTGILHTQEAKEKISNGNKGKTLSEENRKGISERMSGDKHPNWGKPLSPEMKKILSEASSNRVISDETRLKLSQSRKGKITSEDTKKKTK